MVSLQLTIKTGCCATPKLFNDEKYSVCAGCGTIKETDNQPQETLEWQGCCDNPNFVEDRCSGFIVCDNCGVVCNKIIDEGPNWTNYDDSKGSTTQSSFLDPLCPISSTTSIVQCSTKSQQRLAMAMTDYTERVIYNTKKFLTNFCENNRLPSYLTLEALTIFNNYYRHTGFEGKRQIHRSSVLLGIKGACLCLAAQDRKYQLTSKKCAKLLDIECRYVNDAMKKITKTLNIDTNKQCKASDLIEKIIYQLLSDGYRMSPNFMDKSIELTKKVQQNITNCLPKSIASGVLWFMLKQDNLTTETKDDTKGITKLKIAQLCSVSPATIIKIFKQVSEM